MRLDIFIDGASRGNPGPGAAGVVILDTKKAVLKDTGNFLGSCTNNFAEYSALSLALSEAKKLGGTELSIFSDSELVVKQFNGLYRIKNAGLADFMAKIRKQVSHFKRVTLTHIPRELNSQADKTANRILDEGLVRLQAAGGSPGEGLSGGTSQLSLF